VNVTIQWNWSDIFLVAGANWTFGGEWKPVDCVARYHMAVIIPFRDRDFNLRALLHHLIPVLQRQFLHFRIFVVQQVTTVSITYLFHCTTVLIKLQFINSMLVGWLVD